MYRPQKIIANDLIPLNHVIGYLQRGNQPRLLGGEAISLLTDLIFEQLVPNMLNQNSKEEVRDWPIYELTHTGFPKPLTFQDSWPLINWGIQGSEGFRKPFSAIDRSSLVPTNTEFDFYRLGVLPKFLAQLGIMDEMEAELFRRQLREPDILRPGNPVIRRLIVQHAILHMEERASRLGIHFDRFAIPCSSEHFQGLLEQRFPSFGKIADTKLFRGEMKEWARFKRGASSKGAITQLDLLLEGVKPFKAA